MIDKQTPSPAAPPKVEGLAATEHFMGLIGLGWKRAEQLDAIFKAILQRIQDEREAEMRLGLALLQCATPADAFMLSTRWLSERTTAMLSDGPRLAELSTKLYAPPLADKSAPLPED